MEKYHSECMKEVKAKLPRRESVRRTHKYNRYNEILTAIETRISMLSFTFGKYVDSNLCYFIPGKIIDEIFYILRALKQNPTNPPSTFEIMQVSKSSPKSKVKSDSTFNIGTARYFVNGYGAFRREDRSRIDKAAIDHDRVAGDGLKTDHITRDTNRAVAIAEMLELGDATASISNHARRHRPLGQADSQEQNHNVKGTLRRYLG